MSGIDPANEAYDQYGLIEGHHVVRVLGVRRERFIVFEYIAGDPTLTVELVLPAFALASFCDTNDIHLLPIEPESIKAEFLRICEQQGVSLYHRLLEPVES